MYHSEKDAEAAQQYFIDTFKNKETPEEIEEFDLSGKTIVEALVEAKIVTSKSDARRNLDQNGVKVNEEVVTDVNYEVVSGDVIQKGKRFFIKIK